MASVGQSIAEAGPGFRLGGRRVAAIAGIVSTILLLVSEFINPSAPSRGSNTLSIINYYVNHHTGLLLAGYLAGLSILLFFLFLGGLRSELLEAEGEPGTLTSAAYLSGAVYSALALLAVAVTISAVFKVARLGDPVLIRAFYDLNHDILHLIYFPVAGIAGVSALIGLGTRRLPNWHGALGGVTTLAALIAAGGLFADSSNIVTQFSLIGFLLFAAWIVATSVVMYRRG